MRRLRSAFPVTSLLALFAVAVVLATAAPVAAAEQSTTAGELIEARDLLQIVQLSGVTLSPRGTQVAYVTQRIVEREGKPGGGEGGGGGEPGRYRYESQLFLAALDGSTPPRQLTRDEAGASSPAFSPDGGRLAFVRAVDGTPQLFVLPLTGGEAVQITDAEHGAFLPRWSPDGTRLAFLSSLPHDELLREALAAGEGLPTWPLGRPGRGHGDFVAREKEGERGGGDREAGGGDDADAAGDGGDAADVTDEGGDGPAEDDPEGAPEGDPDGDLPAIRQWLADRAGEGDPKVIYRLDFHGETGLSPNLSYSHWFVVDPAAALTAGEPAEARRLTGGFAAFGGGEWLADGSGLIVAGSLDGALHPDRNLDSDLVRIAADGSGAELFLDLPGYSVFNPRVAPDGATIAFQASDQSLITYADTRLGLVPAPSEAGDATDSAAAARLISEGFDRSVSNHQWSADSRHIYFTAPSNGGFPLFRLAVGEGDGGAPEVERLTGYESGVRDFAVGAGGLAYVLTEVANPYELYGADLDADQLWRITEHNAYWLANKRLSYPAARRLTRQDGTEVDYWIMKPTAFEEGKRYPLLLEIHGGPAAMWGPGEATTWHEFQLYAARGFGIVYSNPRGSGGYGQAFRRANYQNWGAGPGGDALAAAAVAAGESWVDPDRQVVTGGSYAGYLTAWIVGNDHRFKAAVAQRGVYDLATFLGEGNAWRLVPWHFGGYPWEEETAPILDRESPLTYAPQVNTPLLIIHSDRDLRTGVIGSELLYKYLKLLDKPVEYVRYPRAAHGLSRTGEPEQRLDRLNRIYEFMSRFVEIGGR